MPNENEILEYFENNKEIYKIPEKELLNNLILNQKKKLKILKLRISGLQEDEILKLCK